MLFTIIQLPFKVVKPLLVIGPQVATLTGAIIRVQAKKVRMIKALKKIRGIGRSLWFFFHFLLLSTVIVLFVLCCGLFLGG